MWLVDTASADRSVSGSSRFEAGCLQLPRPLDVPVDVDARVAGDLRMEPGVLLPGPADAEQGGAKFQLSIAHANRIAPNRFSS
jgi:hypothetical protein